MVARLHAFMEAHGNQLPFLSDVSNRMSDRNKLLTANFARKRAKARRHHWVGTPVTVI
jgi:hypothetical protein